MQTISQKPSYGAHVLSTRINEDAYKNLYTLISNAGYKDTSSFVRDALKAKCRDLVNAANRLNL